MWYPTKKLQEILDKSKFSIWKIKTKQYLENWDFPIIDQWKNLIWWYSNEKDLVYNWKLPVLIYWDHTNIVKYIDFPFIWWADWIKILPFKDNYDVKYCYYLLENYKPETQWYRRHFSFFREIDLPLPPLPTQKLIFQKLDSSFEKIDKSIELTKKNLENIEELNKSVLESFWDFKKVLVWDIFEELFAWWDLPKDWRYSKEKTEEYNIPIFANAIKEDWLYWYTEKPRVTKPAITISARWTIWFTKLRLEPFYPIVRLLVLIPKQKLADLKYLEYILNTINLKQFWSSIPQLSVPQLKSFQIPLPPLERQKQIASHLDQVFEKNRVLKEKYEKKLKDLEEMKQSLLKEAFEWKLVKE